MERHDLRRTGATMLGERGEFADIIEAGRKSPRRCNGWRTRWPGLRQGPQRLCRYAPGPTISDIPRHNETA